MADNRVVTEVLVDAKGVARGVNDAVSQLKRLEKQFGDTNRMVEVTGTQSAARLKANYERLVASFDPVTEAQRKHALEFERQQRQMDRAVQQSVITEQQAHAVLTRLRQQQMAQLQQLRQMNVANNNARTAGLNAGYQIQDIGMMALSGQSPIMLALQQGPQLASALQQAGRTGAGAFATLAAGIGSVLNPLSLAVIGATALTGAVVGMGAAWLASGDEAEDTLEKQVELLTALEQKYGSVLSVVAALNAERQKEADAVERMQGNAAARAAIFGTASGQFESAEAARLAIMNPLSQDPTAVNAANAQWQELKRRIDDGTASTEDATRAAELFKAAFADSRQLTEFLSIVAQMGVGLDSLAEKALKAAGEIAGVGSAYPGQGNPLGLPGTLQRGQERERMRIYSREYGKLIGRTDVPGDAFTAPTPTPRPNDIERLDDEAEAREKIATAAKRQHEAVQKIITGAQDGAEMARLRVATFGMEESARQRLLDQLRIEQDLRARGAELTGSQADAYREAATAASEYAIQLGEMEKRQQEVNEAQAFFGDLAMDGLNSLISGGEKFEDVMKRVGLAIADAMLKAALFGQGPLAGLLGWGPKGGQQYGGIVGDLLNAGRVSGAPTALAGDAWAGLRGAARFVGGAGSGSANFGSGSITDYIVAQAPKYGISPEAALSLARAEGGLSDPFRQAEAMLSYGREQSYGPFQLHMRGGMGANALAAGIDPRTDWRGGVDYALYSAQRGGWGPWMGRQNAGLGIWSGIDRNAAMGPTPQAGGFSGADAAKLTGEMRSLTGTVGQLDNVVTGATGSVGGFGNSIAQAATAIGGAGGGGGGGGGNWLSLLFGGIGSMGGGGWGTTSIASGWGVRMALGGAFPNGISAFSGDIVSSPTLFKFARGAGLMGEAGPEAIMPLQRGRDGKLGVAANGGGLNVTVINQNGSKIETRRTDDGTLEVLVQNMESRIASRMREPGTPLNKAARAAEPKLRKIG